MTSFFKGVTQAENRGWEGLGQKQRDQLGGYNYSLPVKEVELAWISKKQDKTKNHP